MAQMLDFIKAVWGYGRICRSKDTQILGEEKASNNSVALKIITS
jgi:UDP-glucose 6-dehydrogenase